MKLTNLCLGIYMLWGGKYYLHLATGGDGVVQGEWEVVGVFLALLYIVKHVQ